MGDRVVTSSPVRFARRSPIFTSSFRPVSCARWSDGSTIGYSDLASSRRSCATTA